MNHQRTISVQGTSKLKCKPDTVGISFDVCGKRDLYIQAYELVNKMVTSLRDCFEKAGIDKNLLKTKNFAINSLTKLQNDKYVFDGFSATHSMFIENDNDKDKLNKLLNIIVKTSLVEGLNIYYKIRNDSCYRDEAISEAVKQAKHNAEIIAKASEVTLGKILNISYGWSEIRVREEAMALDCCQMSRYEHSEPDIETDDIGIGESVTMTFEILD